MMANSTATSAMVSDAATRTLPRITIVTPSFDQAPFLETAMRSVLDQSYPNLEYIVLDGGSTDGSRAIIERHAGRLAHWASERDAGQTDALIRGFARATGDIFGWLCSDDVMLPGALQTIARECPHDGWLIGSARALDEAGQSLRTILHRNYRRGDVTFNGYQLDQVSVFWSASLYRRVRGLERALYYSMDWDLWTQFEAVCAPRVIPDVLGAYRMHPAQKTDDRSRMWHEVWPRRRELLRGRLAERILHRAHWHARRQLGRLGLPTGVGPRHERA